MGSPLAGVTVPPPFQSPLSCSKRSPAGVAALPGEAREAARTSAASGMALWVDDENKRCPMGIPLVGKVKNWPSNRPLRWRALPPLPPACIMQKKRGRGKIDEAVAL